MSPYIDHKAWWILESHIVRKVTVEFCDETFFVRLIFKTNKNDYDYDYDYDSIVLLHIGKTTNK